MKHQFVNWIVKTHGEADGPVGDLARDIGSDPGFPTRGGKADMRSYLECFGPVSPALDVAWAEYYPPKCTTNGCEARAAGGSSSYCRRHGGRVHQAVGAS